MDEGDDSVIAAAAATLVHAATAEGLVAPTPPLPPIIAATAPMPPARPPKKYRTWDESFAALVAFKSVYDHCLVPSHYPVDLSLGYWCQKLRKFPEAISDERRARLVFVGFNVDVTPQTASIDIRWNEGLERFRKYHAKQQQQQQQQQQSSSSITTTKKKKMDPVLANWVYRQRRQYKNGNLTADKIARFLDAIPGFQWNLLPNRDDSKNGNKGQSKKDLLWITHYDHLVDFHKLYGHCIVQLRSCNSKDTNTDDTADEQQQQQQQQHSNTMNYDNLARWVGRMRHMNGKGLMEASRHALLDKLGFCWSIPDKNWNESYARFVDYVGPNNTKLDRTSNSELKELLEDDAALWRWWHEQRTKHAHGKLSSERRKMIESLGIRFANNDDNNGSIKFYLVAIPTAIPTAAAAGQSAVCTNNSDVDDENDNAQQQQPIPVFSLQVPLRHRDGTKIRKKRFLQGWCNGRIVSQDQEARKTRVVYDNNHSAGDDGNGDAATADDDDEYLSDEELQLCAIAYQLHASPPQQSAAAAAAATPVRTGATGARSRAAKVKTLASATKKRQSGKRKTGRVSTTTTKKRKTMTTAAI